MFEARSPTAKTFSQAPGLDSPSTPHHTKTTVPQSATGKARSLTTDQTAIIKATVPVVAEHGLSITTRFYADLIRDYPVLKNVFNVTHQATGQQARALAGALYAYAANIDDLGALSPAIELICHKHVSLSVKPEQYEIVGENLIKAMAAVLGAAATPDVLNAWGAAYWQLADIMIAKEATLYEKTAYWESWEDFTVAKKVKESDEITSFYFEPVDPGLKARLPVYKPGQYISINMFMEGVDGGIWQARQYSLSDAPGKPYLRISVKKEPGIEIGEPTSMTHPGYISSLLHNTKEEGDIVRLSHPFGDFFFEEPEQSTSAAPLVLISAGVGLTALMSIFNAVVHADSPRPITWIQGARSASTRAFKADMDAATATNKNISTVYFLSSPDAADKQGKDYDVQGRVNLDQVKKELLFTDNPATRYFTCGPAQFMLDVEARLKKFGVPSERIKMELFSTGGLPRAQEHHL